MEKEKKHNRSFIIVLLLCTLLIGITTAYVVLSSTFTTKFGKVNIIPTSWNVAFESGTVTGNVYGSTETKCGSATVTSNTVSVDDILLYALNDKCVYKLKVKNTGAIGAKLTSIVSKTPTNTACDTTKTAYMVCGNITYKLTTDKEGLSVIGTGNTIAPSTGTMDLYLIAEYSSTISEASSSQIGGGFAITFSQR